MDRTQMSDNRTGVMNDQLSKPTSIFGLHLWVIVGVCVGAAIVIFLFLITLWLAAKRSKNKPSHRPTIPVVSKEIQEIRIDNGRTLNHQLHDPKLNGTTIGAEPSPEPDPVPGMERQALLPPPDEESPMGYNKIQFDIGKNHRISYPERFGRSSSHGSGEARAVDQVPTVIPEVSHLGWGHWYTLRELEASTNGFADENVIGEGGYGIVYLGLLTDNTHIAVKNLLNNRGQAEREFKVEVEAIGRVRHKNLVRLLGYCAEGAHRMLVYEYVNNGNLEQWLHGDVGPCSPLTWYIRMNIILGTAKGLSYLHEGLEPKVVHRDIKSSNVLLDKQWNAKVSDFGLAKLLGSETSYITTRVMGTFGYVAPEYASTGMLNERSDVYSFGILIMEIITGRNPVDYSLPPEEVNLVDWLKKMVSNRNAEGVLDPKLTEKPSSRALKRTLLVALRCTDPNAEKRPKMGHIIHMLEAEDVPFKEDRRSKRNAGNSHNGGAEDGLKEKDVTVCSDDHKL
ncbi:Protein kinase family protein [Quillaja saponaria]|uniref:non-specific serine/threonine protein kinase n=1 Tax=Quillaja saponaria TaxID=32244 RepID=A0AAD7PEP6_QUISA|nr:Protein kinase family protein [Quillaja saponaria]KAJ7952844.1 Protein kinase family protein [Quillaja saponaria]